jgi:hypothetical protein
MSDWTSANAELDKTRPVVSTADAVDMLTALGFQRGWLPVRLRITSDG